ncbi:RidA family protein [Thermobifida halotolerans]|uniref:RidA family protein n=1 Tax=Thermobifida halotolerans TaxID=483545 RepID=A0A399G956_9ACTN|nr:RidA family protein [Thermobifida halotolerans]UOE20899.1 RidA family protein [Thermobifida halotolerans]
MGGDVTLIRGRPLTDTVDHAYAAAVEAPVRAVWTAGACPLDAEGNTAAVGDYAGRAHQVVRNLVTALDGAGAGLGDVVRTTVYVATAEQAHLVEVWNAVREYMGEHDAPGTPLGVTVLGYDDQLVEVEAVAVTS